MLKVLRLTTSASVHDSQTIAALLFEGNRAKIFLGDICEKATATHPLTRAQKPENRKRNRLRARVEHVFGRIAHFGGDHFRRMGQARCEFENLLYSEASPDIAGSSGRPDQARALPKSRKKRFIDAQNPSKGPYFQLNPPKTTVLTV